MWCMWTYGLNSFMDYFNVKPMIMDGKCDNKEEDLKRKHMFPRVSRDIEKDNIIFILGYKWKGGIMAIRVHSKPLT